jgi:DNA-binding CsgD family transcriptional regulator
MQDAGTVRCLVENKFTQQLAGLVTPLCRKHPPSQRGDGRDLSAGAHSNSELSTREQWMLEWMISGQSDREIAKQLGVNELTARFHVQNVLSKLRAVVPEKGAQPLARALEHLGDASAWSQTMSLPVAEGQLQFPAVTRVNAV